MTESILIEGYFVAVLLFSLFLPGGIYVYLMRKRAISRQTVLFLGVVLIVISGIDIFLLQHLADIAKISFSSMDRMFLGHEFSVVLYLLPLLFAGVGVNIVSHVLITHLVEAETQFDKDHPAKA